MHECPVNGARHLRLAKTLTLAVNGNKRLRWQCQDCFKFISGDLPHKHENLSQYPVVRDERANNCERCGILGAELHHWAPLSKFNDANEWPTSYLCQYCHRLWHQVMDK